MSTALFLLLAFIAIYVRDAFVRPFLGDTLAVIWLFYTGKSVLNIPDYRLSICVLVVAYGVEVAQYLNLVTLLGLENVRVARIVLGSTFDWLDILAYTLGWFVILGILRFFSRHRDVP